MHCKDTCSMLELPRPCRRSFSQKKHCPVWYCCRELKRFPKRFRNTQASIAPDATTRSIHVTLPHAEIDIMQLNRNTSNAICARPHQVARITVLHWKLDFRRPSIEKQSVQYTHEARTLRCVCWPMCKNVFCALESRASRNMVRSNASPLYRSVARTFPHKPKNLSLCKGTRRKGGKTSRSAHGVYELIPGFVDFRNTVQI